jgi:two-component system chemotaxis response regulator CheY
MSAKVLAVEDNLDMRELLHLYLTMDGFTVTTASDGTEGLYLARAEHPDVIITDLDLPGLDGVSLVRELRAIPELRHTPIIVLTAYGNLHRDEAILAGADRAANKPTDFESLIDDINELLELHRRGSAADD